MRYVAIALAGLLLAAAVHVALMSPAQRGALVRISPSPVATPRPAPPPDDVGAPGPAAAGASAAATPSRARAVAVAPRPSGLVVPVQGVTPSALSPTF